jgi:hypothetical protein
MQMFVRRLIDAGIGLQDDADGTLAPQGLLGGGLRLRPADGQGHDDARKQYGVAHGQKNQRIGRQRRHCLVLRR